MKISKRVWQYLKALPVTVAIGCLSGGRLAIAQDEGGGGGGAGINLDEMGASLGEGFQTWLSLGIQVISVIVFVAVGYGVVSKFLAAIGNRVSWAEVMMPVLVGAFVLVACAYFFTEAQTLADAISVG